MTDEEFREQYKPIHVPSSYQDAQTVTDKIVFALADIGEGTAESVIRHLEELDPQADHKPLIAAAHQLLTEMYETGKLTGHELNGDIIYNLHKITKANDGAVDPDLLAAGLD